MADKPFEISVSVEVKVAGMTIPKAEPKFKVNALTACQPEVIPARIEADGKPKAVHIPASKTAPLFLLIAPVTTPTEPLRPGDLWYGTAEKWCGNTDEEKKREQRKVQKPLLGPHIFFNGSAEWVTDLANDGETKNFSTLYFWNTSGRPISVQIVVGYDA